MSELLVTIQITIVGMLLVFGAILLLWGVMSLLVFVTGDYGQKIPAEDQETGEEQERSHRAALAAVCVALMRELDSQPHRFPLPPTAQVGAWQAVMRSRMLEKRGSSR
jgi:Na+-transporting methylmalonyl-CoA/oxaloacetate decarboxylase gamma subunit